MTSSMTPQGVEHSDAAKLFNPLIAMTSSMTPQGVEHARNQKALPAPDPDMTPSMTPQGVEH